MKITTLKTIILYLFIGLITGFVLFLIDPLKDFGYSVIMVALLLGQLNGLFLYFIESDIYRTIYFRLLIFGLLIFILGVVFKLQHWPKNNLILSTGAGFIVVIYFIRFLNKAKKRFLDYIKFFWLFMVVTGFIFKLYHWHYGDIIMNASIGVFWLGLLYTLYEHKRDAIKKVMGRRQSL